MPPQAGSSQPQPPGTEPFGAPSPRLSATRVSKTFGPAKVLDDVELVMQPGEIHSLVGQNGSGKSTLVKVLTGYHAPDPGAEIALDGRLLDLPVQWRAAEQAGMSVVYQDIGLIDDLTVAENIGIGGFVTSPVIRRIDWRAQQRVAAEILERLEIPVSPKAIVGELSASRRAAVGIARALRHQTPGAGLMILDEATRALPKNELDRFHELVRRVAASGTSILMISHSLEEVLSLSHRVTVLRDGRVEGAALDATGLTELELARLMLDRTVERVAARGGGHGQGAQGASAAQPGPAAATIEALELPGHEPMTIEVARGEVVGVTGLPGTGFEDIPYLVTGARRARGGTVRTLRGSLDLHRATVARAMRAGIALVPESRLREGIVSELSVRDNIALPNLRRKGRPWFVASGWQQRIAGEAIRKLAIKARSTATLLKEMSGGNQQKVLFAKWLSVDPEFLVLHEPTQAVDIGARADLLAAIGEAADCGMGVLLVSAESADLVEICDRILVIHPDRPTRELRGADEDAVLDAVYEASLAAPELEKEPS